MWYVNFLAVIGGITLFVYFIRFLKATIYLLFHFEDDINEMIRIIDETLDELEKIDERGFNPS